MPVEARLIRSVEVGGVSSLSAVNDGDRSMICFLDGACTDAIRAEFGPDVEMRSAGRNILAFPRGPLSQGVDGAELDLFADKNVLVAFRNGETANACAAWLDFHSRIHGADAALVVDRDPPNGNFGAELDALNPTPSVVVASFEVPLGLANALDARHPGLAPAAPSRERPPVDPWHAPLGQIGVYEVLRRRFLQAAKAVVFLNISDVLEPTPGSAFDIIRANAGSIQMIRGTECYPWRLRKGQDAPISDHILVRRGEPRWLASWGTVPSSLSDTSVWQPVRVSGADTATRPPLNFWRTMGVAYPGVPVQNLVKKPDLVEEPQLISLMSKAFDAQPMRLPVGKKIPPRSDRNRVTVVSAMKNEGPFILDWIAHNRTIGIRHHLIYTNDCADGTDRLLDLLSEAGVTRRDNPFRETRMVPQYAAFNAAEDESTVQDADWLLTLDVDEYINVHRGRGRLSDLFAAAPDAHVFAMPWRLFGNSDREAFEDAPVTEQFTNAAPVYAPRPIQAWAFKSIYRNAGLFRRLGVHRPKGIVKAYQEQINWVDGSGRDIPIDQWKSSWRFSKATWGYDLVSLNHYAVRSAESFLIKRERGRVNHVDRDQGLAYWFRMNHNAEPDTSIQRLAKDVAREKAALLALPGVAEAHAASVAWHRARIAELKSDPVQAELFAQITSPRMKNLARMATKFGANVHHYGPELIPDEIAMRDPNDDFFFSVKVVKSKA